MIGKKSSGKVSNSFQSNEGFNSILYINGQTYQTRKLEIDTKGSGKNKKRFFKDTTPKSIDTPQSGASVIDLKKCISNDLFNMIEETSPIKTRSSIKSIKEDDSEEIISHEDDLNNSNDNIILNLQENLERTRIDDTCAQSAQKIPMQSYTHSYFYNPLNPFNQYASHPNQLGFLSNTMGRINQNMFFNSQEIKLETKGKSHNSAPMLNVPPQVPEESEFSFAKLFKINGLKSEEQKEATNVNANANVKETETEVIKETKENKKCKNIITKTINNQEISGWICTQCKNFNYETRSKCNRCARNKALNDIEISRQEEQKKKQKSKLAAAKVTAKKAAEETQASNSQSDKKISSERAGDWVCIKCKNNNFSFRVVCNRCQLSKEESEKMFDLHMKNLMHIGKINENIQLQVQKQMQFEQTCQQQYYNAFGTNIYQAPVFLNANSYNNQVILLQKM